MLGAERLVHGAHRRAAVHVAHRRHLGIAAAPGATVALGVPAERLHWFDADSGQRRDMKHWPYPKWIAHRGAGTLAPENTLAAFRLGASYGYRCLRMRRQAQRRRRALPAARCHARTHHQRPGQRRDQALARVVAARRRQLAQPRLRRRAPAQPARHRCLRAAQRLRAGPGDQAQPRQRRAHRRGGRHRGGTAVVWPGARAAAELVPARCAARGARGRARTAARAAAGQAARRRAVAGRRAGLRRGDHRSQADGRRADRQA
jgi:hypothetical protein